MTVKDSNVTTINHILHDDMAEANKNKENDLESITSEFGPDLPVKIFITKGSIALEFPTLFKNDGNDDDDNNGNNYFPIDERITITIDYFSDKLRIFYNDAEMLQSDSSSDEQHEIAIVPSVKKIVNENGRK